MNTEITLQRACHRFAHDPYWLSPHVNQQHRVLHLVRDVEGMGSYTICGKDADTYVSVEERTKAASDLCFRCANRHEESM